MIIIDGYNLLHASGVFGEARGPLGFEQSRRALLDHLSELLGAEAELVCYVVWVAKPEAPTAHGIVLAAANRRAASGQRLCLGARRAARSRRG